MKRRQFIKSSFIAGILSLFPISPFAKLFNRNSNIKICEEWDGDVLEDVIKMKEMIREPWSIGDYTYTIAMDFEEGQEVEAVWINGEPVIVGSAKWDKYVDEAIKKAHQKIIDNIEREILEGLNGITPKGLIA